jgi:hypothetical protein
MESSDGISDYALDKRISYLESRVRNFRIAVNGTATVEGGFGKLEKSDERLERISNLELAFNKFLLLGNGLSASGSIKNGYHLSA